MSDIADIEKDADKLISWLQIANTSQLATLRGGISEARLQRTWPLLAPFGGVGTGYKASIVQLVAWSYAVTPKTADYNFGEACRKLGNIGTAERYFSMLMDSDGHGAVSRLPQLIMHLKSKGIGLNHKELYSSLLLWGPVTKSKWGKSYWVIENNSNNDISK